MITRKIVAYCSLLLYLSTFFVAAQSPRLQTEWIAGISTAIGSQSSKIGVHASARIGYEHLQINVGYRCHYAWKDVGPSLRRWQQQYYVGGVVSWGQRFWQQPNPFYDLLSHQLRQAYSLGYSFIVYKDNIHTSQRSGQIAAQFYRWTCLIENDLWGGKGGDKFRTAALAVYYRYGVQQWGIRSVLWTANPRENGTRKLRTHPSFKSRYGYYDMNNKRYADVSHGILAAQWQYAVPRAGALLPRLVDAQIGIDAEQVRNFLQNRFIHDMPFVPKQWNKARNPHIPMLDANDKPYLYEAGQKVRPARFWWKLDIDDVGLY